MKSVINWLHITDWHVGLADQEHLWPTMRQEFERDVAELVQNNGPIDLVFFTGDLVQSGERKQYVQLEIHLGRLWKFFETLGFCPKLITIPGNHDLKRPNPTKGSVLALNGWEQQVVVRNTFWSKERSDVRKCVDKCFEEYIFWRVTTKLPLLPFSKGILPGDLRASFEKNGYQIGIIGLNTTFLQIGGGDYEGRLAVSAKQLETNATFDYADWLAKHHFNILLTHQPKTWLCKQSLEEFSRDIAPAGRFRLHLCGHLHVSATTTTSEGGAPLSTVHQGTSFFGLELYGEDKCEVRSHEYLLGQWLIDEETVLERLWPRIAVPKQGGALGLVGDPKCYLQADGAIHDEFTIKYASDSASADVPIPNPPEIIEPKSVPTLPDDTFEPSDAPKRLETAIRFTQISQSHQRVVRIDEQDRLLEALSKHRCAWITTDWGTGHDGFIASAIKSVDTDEDERTSFGERIFVLRCDNFEQVSEIESAFQSQFGMSMQEFLKCVTVCAPACLIIDGVQAALVEEPQRSQYINLCRLILDYGSRLCIITIARTSIRWPFPVIDVPPLDILDLRAYVQAHYNSQPELLKREALERLYEASGGLPVHIDRMLERLRVASLDAVLDEENAIMQMASVEAPLHKSLQQAIEAVRKRDKDNASNSIALLKALSILPFGETIEQMRYFLPKQSLFPRDAELLLGASLIDVILLHQILPTTPHDKSTHHLTSSPKILRVPKQVRDCVLTALSDSDKDSILLAAGEFYFGPGWRLGKKPKLRKIPSEYRNYVNHGVGNEFAVLQLMITRANENGNVSDLRVAARLALHYCGVLRGAARNTDLRLVSKGFLRLLERSGLSNEISELHRLCGRASRLSDNNDEAIVQLQASLEDSQGKALTESNAYALLELSIALRKAGDVDGARDSANRILSYAKEGSVINSQAKFNLLSCEPKSNKRSDSITILEEVARSRGWISHANDLSLSLAFDESSFQKKIKLLDAVLLSTGEGWNRHRAIIEKVIAAIRKPALSVLSFKDKSDLRKAYTYCHSQRLNLFNRCHEALWGLVEHEGTQEELYRLFHHSSFIWRIKGEDEIELRYFEKLQALSEEAEPSRPQSIVVEVVYFAKRAVVLLSKLSGGRESRTNQ